MKNCTVKYKMLLECRIHFQQKYIPFSSLAKKRRKGESSRCVRAYVGLCQCRYYVILRNSSKYILFETVWNLWETLMINSLAICITWYHLKSCSLNPLIMVLSNLLTSLTWNIIFGHFRYHFKGLMRNTLHALLLRRLFGNM